MVAGARLIDKIRPLELTPPQALAMLAVELRFEARKAREELGWRPKPFDTVLREVVARLRADGLLGSGVKPAVSPISPASIRKELKSILKMLDNE